MTNSSKFICLKDASKISGYNQDYLGYLIRTGKLSGEKIGRSWMTTKEDLNNFIKTGSISPIRDFAYSRMGLAMIFGLGLSVVIGATFFVSIQFVRSNSKSADSLVQNELNLSQADNSPIIAK